MMRMMPIMYEASKGVNAYTYGQVASVPSTWNR